MSMVFIYCVFCGQAICEPLFQAGFRTIGVWMPENGMRMDMCIWYPASRQEHSLNYMPWIVNGALNARPAQGPFPLLVISHPTPGTRFSYHGLAEALAREGFVIAALQHARDSMSNMDDMFTWKQLASRANEIASAIDIILNDQELSGCVAPERVGLIGLGSGGAAALLLGGALPNCASWENYCDRAPGGDPYCAKWTREKISNICANFPLRRSLADPRIKAICVIAPGYGMLFDKQSFEYFYPPVLLVGAGRDKFNRAAMHCEPLARILGKKAKYLDLPTADAGALMSPCPPALEQEVPELCNSVTAEERERVGAKLQGALLAFFSHYLKGESAPSIPQPPDLQPQPPPEEAQPARGRAKGRKPRK